MAGHGTPHPDVCEPATNRILHLTVHNKPTPARLSHACHPLKSRLDFAESSAYVRYLDGLAKARAVDPGMNAGALNVAPVFNRWRLPECHPDHTRRGGQDHERRRECLSFSGPEPERPRSIRRIERIVRPNRDGGAAAADAAKPGGGPVVSAAGRRPGRDAGATHGLVDRASIHRRNVCRRAFIRRRSALAPRRQAFVG